MKRSGLPLLLSTLGVLLCHSPKEAGACTTFLLPMGSSVLIGKSYDWHMGQGMLVTNKAGVAKEAIPLMPTDRPVRWVSKYSSLTFNQYGREMPNGGMNHAGLVIEVMWLDSTVLPTPDARPTIGNLQWIQHALDSYGSVAELLAHADDLRVSTTYGKTHYLACDKTSACAAFEYVGGKMTVASGDRLPHKVLTNHTYGESLAYARSCQGLGGKRPPGKGAGSLERFARASLQVQVKDQGGKPTQTKAETDPSKAFAILDSVKNGDSSQWNIVYDPLALRVWFRTKRVPRIKTVAIKSFGETCNTPVKTLDIDENAEGDVTARFADYAEEKNRALITKSLADVKDKLPKGTDEKLAAYPAMLPCAKAN